MHSRIKQIGLILLLPIIMFLTSCQATTPTNTENKPTTATAEAATQQTTKSTGKLKVHYIDVGQADSILIQTPKGQTVLIDGGNRDDGQL